MSVIPTITSKPERLPNIDRLRGLVMVLMTLDHSRDFFSNADYEATDLDKTTVALFFTRWITHYCAPTFIFLAGTSAYLSGSQVGKVKLCRFMWTRGLWIIFLGISFESLAWSFWPQSFTLSGSVLWAIGWSMLILSALIWLPLIWIAAFGLALILGHNAFDGLNSHDFGAFGSFWAILHTGEKVTLWQGVVFHPFYPLIPWPGVMAIGYVFGQLMQLPKPQQQKWLYLLGGGLTALFVLLRFSNSYGDPQSWSTQASVVFTLMSFLNCDKYPPSLCYLLMTLGPAIVALTLFEKLSGGLGVVLHTFGQTPMFFYLLHLPLIIALSLLNAWVITWHSDGAPAFIPKGFPEAYGYGLALVYVVWFIVLLILYPLCKCFRELKRQNDSVLLRYL